MIIRYDKSNVLRKELLLLSDCYPIDIQALDDDAYHYYLAIDKNNGVGYGYWRCRQLWDLCFCPRRT